MLESPSDTRCDQVKRSRRSAGGVVVDQPLQSACTTEFTRGQRWLTRWRLQSSTCIDLSQRSHFYPFLFGWLGGPHERAQLVGGRLIPINRLVSELGRRPGYLSGVVVGMGPGE